MSSEAKLDEGLRTFDELREQVRPADEASQELRAGFEEQEVRIREARRALEAVRAEAAQLDVTRATAESDLTHLAASCLDTVQATLDEVAAEVARAGAPGPARQPEAGGRRARGRRSRGRARRRRRLTAPLGGGCRAHDDARRDGRRPPRQDRADGRGQHDGDRPVRRPRVAPHLPDRAAQGPRRLDRRDQRRDPEDRQDDEGALPGSVHHHQPELRGHLHDAVRRRPGRAGPARRERPARERHRHHRPAARASACRASSCSRAARRR